MVKKQTFEFWIKKTLHNSVPNLRILSMVLPMF